MKHTLLRLTRAEVCRPSNNTQEPQDGPARCDAMALRVDAGDSRIDLRPEMLDRRALAAWRVALGAVVLLDLWQRYQDLGFYAPQGMHPPPARPTP